ncbi:uncharacterized protein LOC141680022 [Apium graveolens]|uniref:uncharacterized protein LOC141680022 n=1 Tax=Apium graveolens TaxID=4045 RepID=UPI003D79CD0E
MGQEPRQASQMLNFVVVKAGLTYNTIMRRTSIHAFKALPSSYRSVIKFLTRDGIGEERGDQKMARSCYVASLRADGAGGSGRLIKWAIKLGEFDIKYNPRTTIKAQALDNFVVECTIANQEFGGQEDTPQGEVRERNVENKEFWVLYFDGASKINSSGDGLILQSTDGFLVKYAIKLDFTTKNNEAEYEALIVGLSIDGTLRVKNLKVCGDSKLVVSQVNGEFEARYEIMAKYIRLLRPLMTQFDKCHVEYIPREENSKADALSKFTSYEIENSSGSVYFRVLKKRSIDVKLVSPIGLGESWIDPIKAHLQTKWLPSDTAEEQKLTVRALRYSLIDGILYKGSFPVPYLRYLRPDED